jgi:TP901 family phage tail tape measure protein
MGVYLDVGTRLERGTAEAALNEARQMWRVAGDDIGSGLSRAISLALGKIDGSGARRTLQELAAEHERLARGADETGRIMERNARNVEIAQKRILDITGGVADASVLGSTKMAKAERDLADAQAISTRSAREHADAVVAASAAHDKLDSAAKSTASSIGTMAAVANGVGVASVVGLGAVMATTTKMAGDFQASQTRLVASAGETAQGLKTVSDGILALAGQVGYTAPELSNAMYDVEKAGFRAGDGVTVLKSAAQGAKSENADLGHVLNGLTTSMNDFGYSADQSADVMSKLVMAAGLSKSNFQDFTGALHSAEPILANIGKSQGLNADQMHRLNADLLGLGAQMTQTGMSAAQSFELIGHAAQKMLSPTAGMRSMLGALGLDAEDITAHLGERGLTGTLQVLQQALQAHTKDGKVSLDVHYQSAQAARAEEQAFNGLAPAAKAVAQQIKDHTLTYAEWRKSRGGVDRELANELGQWDALNSKLTGFSDLIKSGIGDQIDYDQALKILTGDQETLQVALQGTGENADKVNGRIKQINDTTRETDGTVKGFNDTSETLNAKMDKAKAAFGAAGIEIGTMFVPVMTEVANIAKDVGDWMAQNPQYAHLAADAMVGLAGAWTLWKIASSDAVKAAISGLGSVMEKLGLTKTASDAVNTSLAEAGPAAMRGSEGVATATATEIGEENAVADAAARANGEMAGGAAGGARGLLGPAAAVAGVDMAAHQTPAGSPLRSIVSTALPFDPTLKPDAGQDAPWYRRDALSDLWHWISKPEGHAGGGPVGGSGPRGVDSVAAWLAPGEHVLTAGDVDAMGGHAGVYAFRNALHRAGGGPADGGDMLGFDQALLSNVPSGRYSQTGAADLTKGLADCSSAVEGLVHIMDGEAIPAMRQMSTGNEAQWLTAHGFLPGMGGPGDFRVGFNSEHTQATLPGGTPFNWGSDAAAARRGIGGTGAYDPAFTQHFYRPVGAEGMGMDGYYTPNPERVAKVEEEIRHKNDDIHDLEEKLGELKSNAKQSERDRIQHEIDHAKDELKDLNGKLAEAQRGTFHRGRTSLSSRGGGSGAGGMQFGAPLPDRMGLDKGIPGFFEWLTTFVADLAIGPIEGAMLGNYLRSGGMGDVADAVGLPDGAGGFGDIASAVGIPTTALTGAFGGSGSGGSGAASGGGGSASPGGGGGSGSSSGSASGGSGGGWGSGAALGLSGIPGMDLATGALGAPAAAGASGGQQNFIGPVSQDDLRAGAALSNMLGIGPGRDWTGARNAPINDLIERQRNPMALGPAASLRLGAPGAGLSLGSLTAPQSASNNPYQQMYGYGAPGHFATGGPVGTDTIPAWLSPGEFVVNAQATKSNLQALQMMNAGHYDKGGIIHNRWVDPGNYDQPGGDDTDPLVLGTGGPYMVGIGPTGVDDVTGQAIGPFGPAPKGRSFDPRLSDSPWSVPNIANGSHPNLDKGSVRLGHSNDVMDHGDMWSSWADVMAHPPSMGIHAATGGLIGYYDSGTTDPLKPGPGQGQQGAKPGPPQPQGKPQQGQPHLTGSTSPGPGNLKIPGDSDTHPGLATPGADTQQFGEGLPASSGIGFGGGLIGAAEQAAAGAAGAAGGAGGAGAGAAAGMAMNMAFQIMNRTAGYVGQLGGIAAEGILSTLLPADSPLSNFSNTLPGKLVAGVAGVRPGQPNSAGKTEAPMKSQGLEERSREGSGGGDTHHHGVEFNGPVTVQANNPQEFHQQMSRDYSAARSAYPTNMP